MELSQSESSYCEEHGTVSLDIIRKGNLAESSYVTVKVCKWLKLNSLDKVNTWCKYLFLRHASLLQVKEVTATAGKDFRISPSSLVQFDPGRCSFISKTLVFIHQGCRTHCGEHHSGCRIPFVWGAICPTNTDSGQVTKCTKGRQQLSRSTRSKHSQGSSNWVDRCVGGGED